MSEYEIISTEPHTYLDKSAGVVNGVLIRFRIAVYDEVHEARIPKMSASAAKSAIEAVIKERDSLAELG